MNVSPMQMTAVIAMVVLTAVLVFAYRKYLVANSERRMLAMLDAFGLGTSFPWGRDVDGIMKEIRQRCRSCPSEGVCERWLRSDRKGSKDFCPNARVFEKLAEYRARGG